VLLAQNNWAKDVLDAFVRAIAAHRHFERYVDPPPL